MKSFAIYGASDDLVEQEVDGKAHDETGQPRTFSFISGSKALCAKVSFNGKLGTGWKISTEVRDPDEKGDLPFAVRIVQENYSPKLIVEHATAPVTVMCGTKIVGVIEPSAPAVAMKEIGQGTRLADGSWDGDCG